MRTTGNLPFRVVWYVRSGVGPYTELCAAKQCGGEYMYIV